MTNKETKLILRQPVNGLGQKGDVVTVAAGYARNFLVPQGYAFQWTEGAAKQIEDMRRAQRKLALETRESAAELKSKLDGFAVTVRAKVSESGKLFGGVSADKIVAALAEKDLEVNAKTLSFAPIHTTGDFTVKAQLHPEIAAQFTVKVVAEKK